MTDHNDPTITPDATLQLQQIERLADRLAALGHAVRGLNWESAEEGRRKRVQLAYELAHIMHGLEHYHTFQRRCPECGGLSWDYVETGVERSWPVHTWRVPEEARDLDDPPWDALLTRDEEATEGTDDLGYLRCRDTECKNTYPVPDWVGVRWE